MTVVFFISGHGFGHASRQVEIIHALVRARPDVRIIIRSAVNPALLDRTVVVPFELRPGPCDTGIVQASSIAHDDPATIREAASFYTTYDERIDAEVGALHGAGVRLIVGDIAPMAFEVAARLGVPGVAIGNFTWDWIYETHPGFVEGAPSVIPQIRASYRKATLALELPFAGGFDVFPVVRRLSLVARRATRSRAETRAHFDLPAAGRVALLSFGGYGLPDLDLSSIDCLDTWTIVTTDKSMPGVISSRNYSRHRFLAESEFVNSGFRYEDLVATSDVVITKPGFGILAECISTGTAMLYTSRGVFREYDLLVAEMPRYVRCRFIEQPDLLAGRWGAALDALLNQPASPESMATDGDEQAARVLTAMLAASTSG